MIIMMWGFQCNFTGAGVYVQYKSTVEQTDVGRETFAYFDTIRCINVERPQLN